MKFDLFDGGEDMVRDTDIMNKFLTSALRKATSKNLALLQARLIHLVHCKFSNDFSGCDD